MYQCCKMCKLSSYKGNFCDFYNRRTSPHKGWCKEIALKDEYAKVQKEEELKKQYISEKSLLERFGYHSMFTFEERSEFKNKKVKL